jgi:hypothetical protein
MKLMKHLNQRRYAQQVRQLRRMVAPGDRVTVIRGPGSLPGLVINVRGYAHGTTEVYVRADDDKFMGWVPVDMILPAEEVKR